MKPWVAVDAKYLATRKVGLDAERPGCVPTQSRGTRCKSGIWKQQVKLTASDAPKLHYHAKHGNE
ncbi:MAG: hypothetical protein ACE5IR_20160 [bacterium]